jgi:hypothetical protein
MHIFSSVGFDKAHLQPLNNWVEDEQGPVYEDTHTPAYLIDETTGDRYFNETKKTIRLKALAAATVGMISQSIGLVTGVAYRLLRILSFYAFWRNDESPRTFSSRFNEWLTDIFRVILSPLGIPCLFLTGLYGVIKPHDGRKLHARMEVIFHGHPLVVPCMHPIPYPRIFNNDVRRFQVLIFNLLAQPLVSVAAMALRIVRFLSGYAFWKRYTPVTLVTREGRVMNYPTRCEKIKEWVKDGLGILAAPLGTPLTFIGVVSSVVCPEKGKQLLKVVNKHLYGDLVWFNMQTQPHLFGGDSTHRDAW